jgi:hypothetical protein
VLHIAIVNQNLSLVEWLLDGGIALRSRARGSFFKPAGCVGLFVCCKNRNLFVHQPQHPFQPDCLLSLSISIALFLPLSLLLSPPPSLILAHTCFQTASAVLRQASRAVPSRWKRLLSWIQNRDLANDPVVNTTASPDSACYYGEFPLSLAASIGSIEICMLLKEHACRRINSNDLVLRE